MNCFLKNTLYAAQFAGLGCTECVRRVQEMHDTRYRLKKPVQDLRESGFIINLHTRRLADLLSPELGSEFFRQLDG